MTENTAIRPLICDSWRIFLIDLANEVLQFSENKNHRQVKLWKKLHRVYVTIEGSFEILKSPWKCLLGKIDSEIENVLNVIINYCCIK